MEQGFMLDVGDYSISSQAQWSSGSPKTSAWRFSAVPDGGRTLPVTTFRCTSCGRLESFAK
jgi:hypothetical protein